MWGELVEDVLRRLDAEEKLPGAVSSLVLASLLGEIEECLGGQPPERPSPDVIQSAKPVRAYIDSIEAEGFRGIGPRTKLSLTPGPGLTLVVGRNGSGSRASLRPSSFCLQATTNAGARGAPRFGGKDGGTSIPRRERASRRVFSSMERPVPMW